MSLSEVMFSSYRLSHRNNRGRKFEKEIRVLTNRLRLMTLQDNRALKAHLHR
jgi:hypothetical protein